MDYSIEDMRKTMCSLPDRFMMWVEQKPQPSYESRQAIILISAFFTDSVYRLIQEGNLESARQGVTAALTIYKQFAIPEIRNG